MSANITFERRLAAWLAEEAGVSPPVDQVTDILTATSRVRPDPQWLALLKESPMRSNARVVVGSPTRRLALALSLALTLLVASVVVGAMLLNANAGTGDWPIYRGGADRAGTVAGGPTGNPTLRWRAQVGGVPTNVAIVGGLAFVSTDAGVLRAIDTATGSDRWSVTGEGGPMSGPAVADGSVFVVQGDGAVLKVESTSGQKQWTSTTLVGAPTTATVGGGQVYIGSADGLLVALDAASGVERWRYAPPAGGAISAPAFADGVVYAGSGTAGVVALDATTGLPRWQVSTGDEEPGTAVVAEGTVYVGIVGESEGRLRALDAASGAIRWETDDPFQSPAISDGVAYTAGRGILAAFRVADGTEIWRVRIAASSGPPAVSDGVVYVATGDPNLAYAFDARTGGLRWSFELDEVYACCIAPSRGGVYAGTAAGSVYAIGGDGAVTSPAPPTDVVIASPPTSTEPPATTPATQQPSPGPPIVTPAGILQPPSAEWIPQTISVDPAGRLWVADLPGNRFAIFQPDGTFVEYWGESGTGEGQFSWERSNGDYSSGLGFAADGTMFVMDGGNRRVQAFDADRGFLRSWGGFGVEPGQFNGMVGLVMGPDDTIYVLDDVRGVIEHYDENGTVLDTIDAFPNATSGAHLANALAIDAEGNLYVSQLSPYQVTRFDPDGNVSGVFGSAGPGPGQFLEQPGFMAIDTVGRVFVGIGPNRGDQPAVAIFAADGEYLGGFGSAGAPEYVEWPTGLTLVGETLYVANVVGETGGRERAVLRFTLLPPFAP